MKNHNYAKLAGNPASLPESNRFIGPEALFLPPEISPVHIAAPEI
jgi:hypothetical protein